MHDTIRERTNSLLAGHDVKLKAIRFDIRGAVAGQVKWYWNDGTCVIRYNPMIIKDNYEDFLERTVTHEVAHAVAIRRHGRPAANHGWQWQRVMRELGAKSVERCHSYDVKHVRPRTLYCECKEHRVSTRMYNLVARGSKRRCTLCRTHVTIRKEAV